MLHKFYYYKIHFKNSFDNSRIEKKEKEIEIVVYVHIKNNQKSRGPQKSRAP